MKGAIITKRFVSIITLLVLFFTYVPINAQSNKSVCVLNATTGEVVYEENGREKRSMASTTKIMTLLVALENSRPDDIATLSKDAAYEEGSSAYLMPDAKITMEDVLYGLMLNSGNDAAVAVANHIGNSVECFAELMNEKAKEIGVLNTQFKNPNGLEADGHYTTAYDLAVITKYALNNSDFRKIVSSKIHTGKMNLSDGTVKEIEYINHNRLLDEIEGCIGVKTGFTKVAGRCLVSAVERDGASYIVVTLNDPDDWNTHKAMYDMAYETMQKNTTIKKGDCFKHIVSENGSCNLVARDDFEIYTNHNGGHKVEIIRHIPQNIDFPLNEGEKVGYAEIIYDGKAIGKVDIISDSDFKAEGKTKIKNCYMFTFLNLLRNIL